MVKYLTIFAGSLIVLFIAIAIEPFVIGKDTTISDLKGTLGLFFVGVIMVAGIAYESISKIKHGNNKSSKIRKR